MSVTFMLLNFSTCITMDVAFRLFVDREALLRSLNFNVILPSLPGLKKLEAIDSLVTKFTWTKVGLRQVQKHSTPIIISS